MKRNRCAVINQELLDAVKQGNLNDIQILLKEVEINSVISEDYSSKPIHVAAQFGHKHIIEFLLNEGVNVDEKDQDGWTSLHYAAEGGKLDVVEYLIESGANINAESIDGGRKSIHVAAENGHKNILEFFLSKGVSIDETNKDGWTPLHFASREGKVDIVHYLIEGGANIGVHDICCGDGLIHTAAKHGYENVIELLLKKKINIDDKNNYNWTPLHCASWNNHLQVVQFLIYKGANIHAKSNSGEKPIYVAAGNGHKNVVECFLSKGININEPDTVCDTLLHYTASKGQVEVMQFLIDKGANIHAETTTGLKPIHVAAIYGHKNVIEFLLSKGCNIDERCNRGWAPMHCASQFGKVEIVRALLQNRSDVDNENLGAHVDNRILECISKPLNIAAYHGHISVVKLFLEFGTDPNTCDSDGDTPLHDAAEKGHLAVAEYLIENGANINAKNNKGEKPIHIAAKHNRKNIIEFFLDRNVNIDETNKDGWTALHYATASVHFSLMTYLVDKGANIKARTNIGLSPLCIAAQYRPHEDNILRFVENLDELDEINYKNKYKNRYILDFLIAKGGRINVANEDGLVPLHYAVFNAVGRRVCYIVEKLVNAGAKVDIKDRDGDTPLHHAIKEDYLSAVEKMMEAHSGLDMQDNEGNTPLHLLCYKDYTSSIIKWFLDAGARSDIKNYKGHTMLYLYINKCLYDNVSYDEENRPFAQEILSKVNNYIDIDDVTKMTAVHLAIDLGCNMEFLKLILQHQKDLNVEDIDGNTPLNYLTETWSVSRGDICAEQIRLLIENGAFLKINDFQRIIADPSLRSNLLTDIKLCTQSIVNKFNNKDLPLLYGLSLSVPLPAIEEMKVNNIEIRKIEHAIETDIINEGYCDISKPILTSLTMLRVRSYISHHFDI